MEMKLSWEEMPSVSVPVSVLRNRYHDELENYSSVTQKKAYFEAQFEKNSDLLCQNDYAEEVEQTDKNMDDVGGADMSPCRFQMDPSVVSSVPAEIQQVEPSEVDKTQYEFDSEQFVEPEVQEKKKLIDGGDQSPETQTTANDCAADVKKMEKKKRKEKQPSQKVTPSVSSSRIRTVKAQVNAMNCMKDSKSLDAKPVQEKRRDQPVQSANRPTPTVKSSSAKPEVKASTASFNLRSDERAERRKQFYMKLEEKLSAKEAEINQIQAKTQEEKEAQMKDFRRSLNFKATPLPKFYNATATTTISTPTSKNCAVKFGRRMHTDAVGKKEREKHKDANVQKPNDSDRKLERRQSGGRKSGSEQVSETDSVSVDVAS